MDRLLITVGAIFGLVVVTIFWFIVLVVCGAIWVAIRERREARRDAMELVRILEGKFREHIDGDHWVCGNCEEEFIEPDAIEERENLDGENGWARMVIPVCPVCGSRDIWYVSGRSIEEWEEDEDE